MALSSSASGVIVCFIILCCLPSSLQVCSSFPPVTVEEGPSSKDHVLATLNSTVITNLTVSDSAGGYLAVNTTETNGITVFTVFISREIDLEVLGTSTLTGSAICSDMNSPGGYKPYVLIVSINGVNEFPPEFIDSPYTLNVAEDSRVGTSVFSFTGRTVDRDYPPTRQIFYSIENNSSPFTINNGAIVSLTEKLDYEEGPDMYVLTISAQERAEQLQLTNYTTLTIFVTDVDDVGPRFSFNSTYTLALPEGVYSGDVFNTQPVISAKDGDTLNDEVLLELDPISQALADRFTVLSNGSFNVTGTLQPGQLTIIVRAYQTNRPSDRFAIARVLVTVYDVNDHKPTMSSPTYTGYVLEAAVPGTLVLTVSASDEDQGVNSSFQFHLNDTNVPFTISTDDHIGILKVNGSLDRETKQFYILHVYAQEHQSAERQSSNTSEVHVTVLDSNDNSPVFHGKPYVFTVDETDLADHIVGQVNATDRDSGSNGVVVYSIVSTTNTFSINSSSGVITLAKNLTQQDVGVVFLDIRADDSAPEQSRRSQSAQVQVTIAAVNQHPPTFTSAPYTFVVEETAQTGYSLGIIRATDEDGGPLNYSIVNNDNDFTLEGNPPSLLVNGSLDLDVAGALADRKVVLAVSDGKYENTANVTVRVTMVNEYPPVIENDVYMATVRENDTLGYMVLQINATDRDKGTDGEFRFSISSSSDSGPFVVNRTSGVITLNCSACLDYSDNRQYALVVTATDDGTPPRSAVCTVIISVEDVNNKEPQFSSATITGTVSEDDEKGTTVLKLQADDEDTPTASLAYRIENVTPAGWLALHGAYVVTNSSLDAEFAREITATVHVTDGIQSNSASLNVTVRDVNDNYPQISLPSSSVDIPENATVGTSVTTVTAHDSDVTQGGSFLFYLGSSPSGKFAINSSSGEITVAAPFDRRLRKDYDVTITVSDNSAPPKMNSTTLHVVITDSNSAPVFVDSMNNSVTFYVFNVSETKDVGYVIGHVSALDPDSGSSGQVQYRIDSGNDQDKFLLDEDTGTLSLLQNLDYEQKDLYSLVLIATDNSFEPKQATVTVMVMVDDVIEAPQWPDALPPVYLTADQQCDDVQLGARSQDILQTSSSSQSAVVYSLLNNTNSFSINNETGVLRRKGSLSVRTYKIGIRACSVLDETVCSDTVLTVQVSVDDVITFCPPFFTVHVNESVSLGHVVADMKNSTKGDTNITYSLKDISKLPFRVNDSTGIITVNGTLDREKTPRYTLEIIAVSALTTGPATAQVTVVIEDAPDTAPRFRLKRYDGAISEAAPVGRPVLTVPTHTPLTVAADDDDLNPTLTYSISQDDNSGGAFTVNSTTGEITLKRPIDLENMTADLNGQYTLTVTVSDGYFADNATVVIRILNNNDNSPVFEPDILNFTVSEAELPPFEIARLSAKDLDAGDTENLRYALISSAELPFALSSSGILQLTKRLDRETTPTYTFTVVATDSGGRNGTAQVNAYVRDANERPHFNNSAYVFLVMEGPNGVGTRQLISAADDDLGNNSVLTFAIQSGDPNGNFSITTLTNSSAVLRVVGALDREAASSLTLTVTATDGGQPPLTATCTVEVIVEDVDDNDPVFDSTSYSADIRESASNNTQLLLIPTVSVTDRDDGLFGRQGVIFSLEPTFPTVPFRVDSVTGSLFVALVNDTDHLDREVTPTYTLTLVATDDNGQGRNGTTTVTVSLTNVNDHKPTFLQSHYSFTVSENAPVGQLVATLNATDKDGDLTGLRFYIHPSKGQGNFYLNPVTGELQVSGPLDRETQEQYILALGVYDQLSWGNATATITVEDVNDNCPLFNNDHPLALNVTETMEPGVIYVFNVTDRDAGSNADVILYTNDTTANQYLSLSANGTLRTIQKLDREKDDEQSLTFIVKARDGGSPPCVTPLRVRLDVLGDNEMAPVVCQITRRQDPVCGRNISVFAFDRDLEGTFLAALTWRDNDEGEGGQATLSLDHDTEQLFFLNQTSLTTSILTLAKELDVADLAARGRLGDNNRTYTVEVMAEDKGQQPKNSRVSLTLTVQQRQPSTPVFSNSIYYFSVSENQPATVIGNVKATVQNGEQRMNYTLESTSDFEVNNLGNISTQDRLDRERSYLYTFLVLATEATQSSATATAAVLVTVLDENDNTPQFSPGPIYSLSVVENLEHEELLTFVVTDDDAEENGDVTFTLVNSSYGGIFTVNSTSGQLWLNKSLDRETESSYILYVQASDGGTPPKSSMATVEITVQDLNDNVPQFSEDIYVAYLDENEPEDTLVKNVSATDMDSGLNGHVLYQLVSEVSPDSPTAPFFINTFTGAIYTSRSFRDSGEEMFNLTVKAQDLGRPSQSSLATVVIHVNDLSKVMPNPVFDPDPVALVLGTPASTPLSVNVSGGSGTYNFSIIGGDEDGVFTMDKDSGQLTVTKELTVATTYQLTIRIVNLDAPQYYADGTLTVTVTSVKLEQERYAAVITENVKPPFLLLDINSNAERAGIPVTYTLQGQGIDGVFTIERSSGQLNCIKSLNREDRSEYIMQVFVQLADGTPTGRRKRALSSEAEVRVIVDDVNDNPPQFDVTSNLFGIPSTAPAYTVVTTLQAKDPDYGDNGEIEYTVTGGDRDKFFVSSEGQVTSLVPMKGRKYGEQFQLTVNATDNNGDCAGPSGGGAVCHSTAIKMTIVVVPNSDRFGLVANVTVKAFLQRQQFYLGNLSDILNMTLQLDKVEPHQGTIVDTSKSDIYFYAFDGNGKPIPFTTIDQQVKANAEAINALFNLKSVQLIPVTEPPTIILVQTKEVMGEAEIAVIVVACLIFLGSFVAIILTIRAWRKQKEFQKREEAAARARQRLEQETRELADKLQETSFVTDPEEPLELHPTRAPVNENAATEVQECFLSLGDETTGLDTVTLKHTVLRKTEAAELEALLEEQTSPESNEVDSGIENNNGSLSSGEHQENGSTQPEYQRSATVSEDSGQSSTGQSPPDTPRYVSMPHSTLDQAAQPNGSDRQARQETPLYGDNKQGLSETVSKGRDDSSKDRLDKPHYENAPNLTSATNSQDKTPLLQDKNTKETSAVVTEEDEDIRLEDPAPDYQKRVSFSDTLDVQEDETKVTKGAEYELQPEHATGLYTPTQPATNYLNTTSKLLDSFKAKKSEELGVVNPVFQEDEVVLDGWAEDYDNKVESSQRLSTAL